MPDIGGSLLPPINLMSKSLPAPAIVVCQRHRGGRQRSAAVCLGDVTEQERILGERGKRIRDVRVGSNGYLYILTDESNGELLKVSPAG